MNPVKYQKGTLCSLDDVIDDRDISSITAYMEAGIGGLITFKPWVGVADYERGVLHLKRDEFYTAKDDGAKFLTVARWSHWRADNLQEFKQIARTIKHPAGCYLWLWHDVDDDSFNRLD